MRRRLIDARVRLPERFRHVAPCRRIASGEIAEIRAADLREIRQHEGSVFVVGYAAIFDVTYPVFGGTRAGGFEEVVRPGAFAKTIRESDIRLLFDHEGMPLARTKAGTLRLVEDLVGLRVEAEIDLRSPHAQALATALERGDVDQMSIGFETIQQRWTETADSLLRELLEVRLFDVSVVTFPANEATSVGLRSTQKVDDLARALEENLIEVDDAISVISTVAGRDDIISPEPEEEPESSPTPPPLSMEQSESETEEDDDRDSETASR